MTAGSDRLLGAVLARRNNNATAVVVRSKRSAHR